MKSSEPKPVMTIYSDSDLTKHTHSSSIGSFAWSPDSSSIIYSGSSGTYLFDVRTDRKIKLKNFQYETDYCSWSPNGKFIAVAGATCSGYSAPYELQVLKAETQQTVFRIPCEHPYSAAWAPSQPSLLAVRTGPERIRIYDAQKNWLQRSLINITQGRVFVWSPDSKQIAVSNMLQDLLTIYSPGSTQELSYQVKSPSDIAWAPDGKLFCRTGLSDKDYQMIDTTKSLPVVSRGREKADGIKRANDTAHGAHSALPKFGVIDLKEKIIVPLEFFAVKELNVGTYAASTIDNENPKMSPSAVQFFKNNGKVELKLPEGLKAIETMGGFIVVAKIDDDRPNGVQLRGLCDSTGRPILKVQFKSIDYVCSDFIVATTINRVTSTHRLDGSEISKLPVGVVPYSWIRDRYPCNDHRIPVRILEREEGYCDENGRITFRGTIFGGYSDGLASVLTGKSKRKFGLSNDFINTAGSTVIELEDAWAGPFKAGYSIIRSPSSSEMYGVIDRTGKYVIDAKHHHLHSVGSKIFAARTASNVFSGKDFWQIINTDNKVVLEFPSDTSWVGELGDELIPFCIGGKILRDGVCPDTGGKWGYLNIRNGKVAIEPKFATAAKFTNGLAVVTADFNGGFAHTGIIDTSGRFVISPIYDSIQVARGNKFIAAKSSGHHFSSLDWRSRGTVVLDNRMQDFLGFLRDYNLIGMKRSEILSLLGPPERSNSKEESSISYSVLSTGCIYEHVWVVIEFSGDAVQRWRWSHSQEKDDDWITDDVMYSLFRSDDEGFPRELDPPYGYELIRKRKKNAPTSH